MEFYDVLRSLVTNAFLVTLLFTLGRSKCKPKVERLVLAAIVLADFGANLWFYSRNDYTMLAKADIAFFLLAGIAAKPLFREKAMPWLFNCLTTINVSGAITIITYYLADLFPYPYYANTVLRAALFGAMIWLFRSQLRPLYRQAAERWDIYLVVAAGIAVNFGWYFLASDDVEKTLQRQCVPLLLLTALSALVYYAVFHSLRENAKEAALREENLKMQSERELTRQRLALMEESVRQMSIVQHDRRHLGNTLLALLAQGETEQAASLIRRQSEALPQKPQSYCQNVPVNAAVSYYAEMAAQRGICCDIRLDIPEKLDVDELSLAMAASNLMENAVNAVTPLPAPRRALRFTAVYTGQLVMELRNPYDGEAELDDSGLPVSRKEGHGRGTQSVAEFVKRCGGELVYETSGGEFIVRLMV
ncbi:sensor histidine kinase [Acidaminobacterium chupaoyuni]